MTLCVSDWMKLKCGDLVRERDGRHVGRVEAIHHGAYVKVRWLDTGWITFLALHDVCRLKRNEQP